jgi:hypothetical protein
MDLDKHGEVNTAGDLITISTSMVKLYKTQTAGKTIPLFFKIWIRLPAHGSLMEFRCKYYSIDSGSTWKANKQFSASNEESFISYRLKTNLVKYLIYPSPP